jgi:cellulose synthase/poly-beta-1,6-N-acetylglucosamine synthase-like glycosyltransferase
MTVHSLLFPALVLVNLAVLPFFLYLLAISLAALLPRRTESLPANPASRFLIVIPAHDEVAAVSTVVRSCLAATYPRSQFGVLVIADNCCDQTASLAASAGARVVERTDDKKKSKGYALEYLIESLERSGELDSIDALVVVDADTTIDRALLLHFESALRAGCDWVQAYYTVANPDESWRTRLLKYALSLFNGVMPLGQNRLGGSAAFKGNGMCFSVRGLKRVPWRCYGLVEDQEYAWTLRLAGEKIWFDPDVSVYGAMLGKGGQAAASQRRRWEFGRSEVRKKYLGPLLRTNRIGWWEKMLSLCELTMPPLGVIAVIFMVVVAADAFVLFGLAPSPTPVVRTVFVICSGLMTASLCAYGLAPFLAMRLEWRYALSILFFPFYLVWKFWISFKGRPDRWVRTARESRRDEPGERTDEAPLPR